MITPTANNELDAKSFKRLKNIHLLFCLLMIVFIVIIIGFNQLVGGNIINRNDNSLLYVGFLATVLFPIISNFIFYKRLEAIDLDEPVKFRFGKFLTANVIRLFMVGRCRGVGYVCMVFNLNLAYSCI